MICPNCGKNIGSEFVLADESLSDKSLSTIYHCYHCNRPFTIVSDGNMTIENTGRTNLNEILPVLKEGEIVRLDNKEHPWYNEIALICERAHKFYRLEIHGNKIWVPEDWVTK